MNDLIRRAAGNRVPRARLTGTIGDDLGPAITADHDQGRHTVREPRPHHPIDLRLRRAIGITESELRGRGLPWIGDDLPS